MSDTEKLIALSSEIGRLKYQVAHITEVARDLASELRKHTAPSTRWPLAEFDRYERACAASKKPEASP